MKAIRITLTGGNRTAASRACRPTAIRDLSGVSSMVRRVPKGSTKQFESFIACLRAGAATDYREASFAAGVWWLARGIDLERSRPGCPQDNGAHERMHLDIRRELQSGKIGRDQNAFDLWRHEYNNERPHEALAMKRPAEIYIPSTRPYEGTPDMLDYGNMETRKVTPQSGMIRFRSERIMLSTALAGWNVGLAEQLDGQVEVWFASLLLGHIDPKTSSFRASVPARGAAATVPSGDSATLHRPNARNFRTKAVQPAPNV